MKKIKYLILLFILITIKTNANELIGCINTKTYQTKIPIEQSKKGCRYGKNWMNIYKPDKKQYEMLKQVFTIEQILNRLPIINKESQFNSKVIGYHRFGRDCLLLQIRDIRGGCKMTDLEQLKWLKNRMESQVKTNCRQYRHSEIRLLRCLYSRHNGKLKAFNSYDNLLIKTREFYIKYYTSPLLNNKK